MRKLRNRIALVTGSSSGVGAEIARELAWLGAEIVINGRNKDKVVAMQKELESTCGIRSYSCVADGTDDQSVYSAVDNLFPPGLGGLGRLDILVNNIGGLEKFGTFLDLTDEDWVRSYQLNCLSAMRFTRHTLKWLKKSKFPRIINISSISSRQLGNKNPHYGCAKMALNYLTKSWAREFAPWHILVNAICPSTLEAGEWEENVTNRAKRENLDYHEAERLMRQEEKAKSPLNKMGTAEDIAKAVAFLASEENQFISGALLQMDGATTRVLY